MNDIDMYKGLQLENKLYYKIEHICRSLQGPTLLQVIPDVDTICFAAFEVWTPEP